MTTERLPDDCLPFAGDETKLAAFLRGPAQDAEGKIIGGLYHGRTVDDMLADRDAFNRAMGE